MCRRLPNCRHGTRFSRLPADTVGNVRHCVIELLLLLPAAAAVVGRVAG